LVKVCPGCGRTEKEVPFIGYLCRDCYLKEHEVVHIPKKLEIKQCPRCGRIYTDRWTEFSLEALSEWLSKRIRTDLEGQQLTFSFPEIDEDRISFIYIARGAIEGVPVEIKGQGEIKVRKELCPRCARESGGYYEAILQLRGPSAYEMVETVAHRVEREPNDYAFVSKVVERREGVDLYVGSRKAAERAAKKIARKYHARLVKSHTLVTEKNGKKLYRLTVAIHFPDDE
jgi:nonsense-mediated mRNA decay protein 3